MFWFHCIFQSFVVAEVFVLCFRGEREFLYCKLSSAGVQFTLHVKENSRDLYSGLFRVSTFGVFLNNIEP